MKRSLLFAAALAAALLMAGASNATVYFLRGQDIPPATVSGTITTDGALGVLSSADILSVDVTVADESESSTVNYEPTVFEAALTATKTGLFFDFSGDGSLILFNGLDASSVYCVAAGTYGCEGEENLEVIKVNGAIYSGPVQSAEVQIAAVPEPGTWVTALVGFGSLAGLAALTRRRRAIMAS